MSAEAWKAVLLVAVAGMVGMLIWVIAGGAMPLALLLVAPFVILARVALAENRRT